MLDTKSLIESKSFWSALLALVAIVASAFHVSALAAWAADPATLDGVINCVALIGTMGAIVFRATATSQITSVLPATPPKVNSPLIIGLAALAIGGAIMLGGCTTAQLDAAANAVCSAATAEANAYASSTDPKIKVAAMAVGAVCADPSATVAQVNAARVELKNALKGS